VGKHCVSALLDSSHFSSVTTVGRRPLVREHPHLTQLIVDYDDLSATEGLVAESVFCCLGTTMRKAGSRDAFRRVDFEYPLRLARLALDRGAVQFLLVSSLGASPSARTFYLRVKGELEQALSELSFQSLVILRPSLLVGDRDEVRWGERFGEAAFRLVAPLFRGALRRYRPVDAQSVARTMVAVASEGRVGRRIIESEEIARLADR
jgi:uncharacterized protein YbjT (DUF2867 family)